MAIKIQVRRGTAANWTSTNPVLSAGELAFETDTGKLKVGDGATAWVSLAYAAMTASEISSAIAAGVTTANEYTDDTANTNLALHEGDVTTHGVTGYIVGTTDAQTLTNKTMGDDLLMDGNQVSGLGTPTQADHAATKSYVDGVSQGLNVHDAARAATTENITISTALVAGQVLDGVTLVANDRVLVKNQSTASQNGIYTVQASGAAIRATDYDSPAEAEPGDFLFVTSGTVNAGTGWTQTATIATIGSDPIVFTQFSGAGSYLAGTGLTLTSNVFAIDETITATKTYVDTAAGQALTDASDYIDAQIIAHNTDTNVHGIADFTVLASTQSPTFTGNVVLPSTTTIGSVSSTELEILNGATLSTAELNTLDGITATTTELNILAGATLSTAELNTLDGITTSVAELNILDGVTATAAELNILDGVTASTYELNTLDGITASTAELNILDGVTATATELNYVDGVTSAIQTQLDGKASSTDLSTHNSDTTDVHGIADTSALETQTGSQAKADSAETAANGYTDTVINALTTSDIEEGTNLYFTNERAQDAVGANVGDGLNYDDASAAISVDTGAGLQIDGLGAVEIDSTVATLSGAQTLTNKTIDTASNSITVVAADISDVTASAAELNTLDGITASTAELNILDGVTATAAELNYVDGVTSAIQTQLDGKADLSGDTFTGNVVISSSTPATSTTAAALVITGGLGTGDSAYIGGDLIISGDFTVNGTTTTVNATDLSITDPLIYIGEDNVANSSDLGLVASFNDGTYQHSGIVRDASDGKWKFFKGVTDEPTTTVNFGQGSLDALAVAAFEASSATIGDVSNTELQYLNGVTSAVQTQLDAKAPLANPTFTGTVAGVTKSHVGLGNVDNTSDVNKPVSTATQTALDGKQATVTGAATTITGADLTASRALTSNGSGKVAVSAVTSTELAYVSGVTSAIQTQLDAKAPLANPTFTGTVTVASNGVAFTDATQTKAGVPSISTFATKTASYTMGSVSGTAERDLIILMDSTSSTTVSIPTDATTNFPIGTSFDVIRLNTGALNIAAVTPGTTSVVATPGLNLRARYSSVTCLKIAANSWIVYGDLAV